MARKYRSICSTIAILLTSVYFTGCGNIGIKNTKDDFIGNESLSKYRSSTYSVSYIESGTKQEKFVFETVGESKMVWGGEVHFTNIDITDSGNVEIKFLEGEISSYQISPVNKNFNDKLKNGILTLSIKPYDKVWIELNGDKQRPLMLFGNPIKPAVPEGAIYFPAGVHNIGRGYKVKPDTTLYLDEGAYLIGSIDARNSKNVTIMGRGIISGEYKSGSEVMAETGNSANWALFTEYFTLRGEQNQEDFIVDGVTIINTPNYNTYYVNEFYNVKIISPWVYTSDGFHAKPTAKKPGIVKNCFAFVADDIFYSSYNQFGNLEISDSFGASTNNNIFLIGYWGWNMTHDYYANVKNIYVKPFVEHAIFQGVIDGATNETGFKNQTYENIFIEGNINCPLIWLQNRYYPWPEQHKNKMLGNARNIVFKNITLTGRQFKKSKLLGLDAENGLQDITLENIEINNAKITTDNLNDYFETNQFSNLIVK